MTLLAYPVQELIIEARCNILFQVQTIFLMGSILIVLRHFSENFFFTYILVLGKTDSSLCISCYLLWKLNCAVFEGDASKLFELYFNRLINLETRVVEVSIYRYKTCRLFYIKVYMFIRMWQWQLLSRFVGVLLARDGISRDLCLTFSNVYILTCRSFTDFLAVILVLFRCC